MSHDFLILSFGVIIGVCLTVAAFALQHAVQSRSKLNDLEQHMRKLAEDYVSKNPNMFDGD